MQKHDVEIEKRYANSLKGVLEQLAERFYDNPGILSFTPMQNRYDVVDAS